MITRLKCFLKLVPQAKTWTNYKNFSKQPHALALEVFPMGFMPERIKPHQPFGLGAKSKRISFHLPTLLSVREIRFPRQSEIPDPVVSIP